MYVKAGEEGKKAMKEDREKNSIYKCNRTWKFA